MNSQTLDLMIELQPVFEKYRGEWKVGDKVQRRGFSTPETITVVYASRFPFDTNRTLKGCVASEYIWLPPLYDDEQPERSLLGMLGYDLLQINNHRSNEWEVVLINDKTLEADTPTLAVLRAIKEQAK